MAKKHFLVLVAASIEGINYSCGSVINIEKSVGDAYAKGGQLDGAPSASKSAIANGADVIEHVSDAGAEAEAATAKTAAISDLEARIAVAADADKPALQAELDKLKAE